MAWQNADGLYVKYGNDFRVKEANRSRGVVTDGTIKEMVMDFDLSRIASGTVSYPRDLNNDGTNDGFHLGDPHLPANASVIRATIVMTEAAAGGTSITVGTYGLDGTAQTATGLVTATEGVLANLNAVGKRTYGAGAFCAATAGTAGVGAADAFIGIAATGTFTAGKGRLIVEFIDPLGDL